MSSPEADRSPTTSDYQKDFLRILNNRGKVGGSTEGPARSRGFVVITRGATSLTPLQTLCFDERQTYNSCLTARYRLQPSTAIGTLLMAFIADLIKINRGEKGVAGVLRSGIPAADKPDSFQDEWKRLAELFIKRMDANFNSLLDAKQGTVDQNQLAMLSEALKSESILTTGNRLVLFGEFTEETANASDWQAAAETLSAHLPERVGLVLSGAPKDFVIPPNDPHFLEITLPAVDNAAADPQAGIKFTNSSFHSDEPASKDQLDVNDYAEAIARFILHPQTTAPLTLGINGRWGKGKSSFMNLVRNELVKYAHVNRNVKRKRLPGGARTRTERWTNLVAKLSSADTGGKAGLPKEELQKEFERNLTAEKKLWKRMQKDSQKNVLSVTFNAWQFEDAKQTWAGLASQISETIEKSLPLISRQWLKFSYAWKVRRSELILNLLLPLAIFLIVGGLVSAGFFAKIGMEKPEGQKLEGLALLLQLLLPGSALLTIWFVGSQLLKVAVPISERVLSYTRMPNYREQMGFQHRVKDDLQFIHDFLIKRRKGNCRVVVFIDDLDRCSEHKIMELLQAINLILGSSRFFVFVGMDTKMIHRAIRAYYKETPVDFPDSYLRKIVQISFYLPDTMSEKLADYVNTLFSPDARLGLRSQTNAEAGERQLEQSAMVDPASGLPYNLEKVIRIVPVRKETEDTSVELRAFRDYSDYLGDNPREIKRLVNVHRLTKILVQKPSTSWSGPRQRKLVKWLIFCDRWPHLVDDVLKQKGKHEACDILGDLARKLAERESKYKGIGPSTSFNGLEEFAKGAKPGPDKEPAEQDVLLFKDIDTEFRSAAELSQLIVESPEAAVKQENSEKRPRKRTKTGTKPRIRKVVRNKYP